jgi:hypothetical protein
VPESLARRARVRRAFLLLSEDQEVSRAAQTELPRRRVLSRSSVSGETDSHRRRESNAVRASWAATKSSGKSWDAMTHAHAYLAADFKNCCMLSGEFDGSDRHHFFQRLKVQ